MITLGVFSILTLAHVLPPVWTSDWWLWFGSLAMLEFQLWRIVRALQRRRISVDPADDDKITLHEGKLVRVRMNKPKGKP